MAKKPAHWEMVLFAVLAIAYGAMMVYITTPECERYVRPDRTVAKVVNGWTGEKIDLDESQYGRCEVVWVGPDYEDEGDR